MFGGCGSELDVRRLFPWLMVTEVPLTEPGVFFVSTVDCWSIELLLDVAISLRLYFPDGWPLRLLVTPLPFKSNELSSLRRLTSIEGL